MLHVAYPGSPATTLSTTAGVEAPGFTAVAIPIIKSAQMTRALA